MLGKLPMQHGQANRSAKGKVTVIMPVFNTEPDFLATAIDSILKQTYRNFELFVIDDGSLGYISEMVSKLNDPRIFYHKCPANHGIVAARNYGLDHANGEFIAFQDSDDWSYPSRIEMEVRALEEGSGADFVYSNVYVTGQDKHGLTARFADDSINDVESYLIFKGNCICLSSVMIRRSVLTANGIRFEKKYEYAEDHAFWLSLVGRARFLKLENRLACYRYHFSNLSHTKKHRQRSVSCRAQLDSINRLLGLNLSFFSWARLQAVNPSAYSLADLQTSLHDLETVITALKRKKLFSEYVKMLLQKKAKSIFYHSHGMRHQCLLFRHPLGRELGLGFGWRLYCFLTRCR